MKISKDDVLFSADLANISVNDAEIMDFKADLEDFLTFAEQLDEVNTEEVAPTVSTAFEDNTLRNDIALSSLEKATVLSNSKNSDGNGFVVPKVVE